MLPCPVPFLYQSFLSFLKSKGMDVTPMPIKGDVTAERTSRSVFPAHTGGAPVSWGAWLGRSVFVTGEAWDESRLSET